MVALKEIFEELDVAYDVVISEGVELIRIGIQIEILDQETNIFTLYVLPIEDGWGNKYVRFEIVPFVEKPHHKDMNAVIAQINHNLPILKLASDTDGDIELICDMYMDDLTVETLTKTLQTLGSYAQTCYLELSQLKGYNEGSNDEKH